jgi:hypothetical protein
MPEDKDFWFPAKTYGWGWGPPVVWQGWAVLGAYAVLLGAGFLVFGPTYGQIAALGLSLVLVLVCWWKGEATTWRWGRKD